ncbi:hypothetical protein NB063_28415 [Rhodopirellula sp. ICT_H3.1]|uniref:Uncharacterized protein n=1 Tax=Aporhodopirellula aestuarii TaxID=2950107 RepID=A0ABT0UC28_9BACT|nr:hypothetical protein [Aporhodopirellula aestuarii]MCM2374563.1 hypothetical protein [Aporhodopirellula aestuarii]
MTLQSHPHLGKSVAGEILLKLTRRGDDVTGQPTGSRLSKIRIRDDDQVDFVFFKNREQLGEQNEWFSVATAFRIFPNTHGIMVQELQGTAVSS